MAMIFFTSPLHNLQPHHHQSLPLHHPSPSRRRLQHDLPDWQFGWLGRYRRHRRFRHRTPNTQRWQ